jgi:hypothetical protein
MDLRTMVRAAAVLLVLLIGPTCLHGQVGGPLVRFEGGLASPRGSFDDMVDWGPSFSAELVYPLRDRFALLVGTTVDILNNHDAWPVPDMRLWNYQLGIEATVLQSRSGDYALALFGKAGGAVMESDPFLTEFAEPVFPYAWEELFNHHLTTGGGARIGFGLNSVLAGWVTGQFSWTPLNDSKLEILEEATNFTVPAPSSAVTAAIRAGFSFDLRGL